MRLLLDTHVALWLIGGDSRLKRQSRDLITAAEEVAVSIASLWEIAIKYARPRGKPGDMPLSSALAFEEFDAAGLELLPILPAHVITVGDLPPHHGDPFDRMLIAQAIAEPMYLLTADTRLAGYGGMIKMV